MFVMEIELNHNLENKRKLKHTTKPQTLNTTKITKVIGALQQTSKRGVDTPPSNMDVQKSTFVMLISAVRDI